MEFIELLKTGIPLEHITKHKYFYNTDFYIDERGLIPRFDSESMISEIINLVKKIPNPIKVCEIGVGSGCLSLSLLKEATNIDYLLATDISNNALELFAINKFRNTKYLKCQKIETLCTDRFNGIKDVFDLILSNPPYIPRKLKNKVHLNTDKFEPHEALYLEDESYFDWFKNFFEGAHQNLKTGGHFFMEAHEDTITHLQELGLDFFQFSLIKKDLLGNDRYLHMVKG